MSEDRAVAEARVNGQKSENLETEYAGKQEDMIVDGNEGTICNTLGDDLEEGRDVSERNSDADWEPEDDHPNVRSDDSRTNVADRKAELIREYTDDVKHTDMSHDTKLSPRVKDEDVDDSDEIVFVSESIVPQKRKLLETEPGEGVTSSVLPPSADDKFNDDELLSALQAQAVQARQLVQERHRLLNVATEELRNIEELIAERHAELRRAADAAFDWNAHSFAWDEVLAKELDEVFHIRSFRPLQREALNATLSGRDVYAILPTGAGKSLIYQLAAVVDRGLTLVVTPLIALSLDQQKALRSLNIRAETLDSTTPKSISKHIYDTVLPRNGKVKNSSHPRKKSTRKKAKKKKIVQERAWVRDDMETTILFVTPEQIVKSKRLLSRVEMLYEEGHLSRIVIDEAHCCSLWGHDYRPDYRKLGVLKRQLGETPILGLTATSSPETTDDVCKSLEIPNCVVFRGSINRPNLFYQVIRKKDDEDEVVSDIANMVLNEFKDQSGIIYVLSRRDSETYAEKLQQMGINSGCYHGDMDQQERTVVHGRWHKGVVQVVVATIAFGLGIDKANVRFVIHATMASSMEGYYQESGRAGRDGKPAKCILMHRPKDFARLSGFVADKGEARLSKMYEMYQYASGRLLDIRNEEGAASCRRILISKSFQETPPPRAAEDRPFCCDLCAGRRERVNEKPVLTDVTALAKSITRIMIHQCSRRPDEKITILALATAWGNRGEKGRRMRGEEPAADRKLSLDVRMEIIIGLVFKGVLQEFHRHTAHAVNAYVTEGPRSTDILQDGTKVEIVLRTGDSKIVQSL